MKSLKKASGITLIALVITIVVLIILATVSINMILDDDGIIGAAQLAKDKYQNAAKEEQEGLDYLYEELTETLNSNVDMVKSEDNVYVPVPKGYVASTIAGEKSVSTGFVIKKGTNGAATSGVNEFVWVPVSDESFNEMFITAEEPIQLTGETGVTTQYYSNLRIIAGDKHSDGTTYKMVRPGEQTGGLCEPDYAWEEYGSDITETGYSNKVDMSQGFVDDYANMRESIKKYKGFYIGRYELTGSVGNPTVQSGTVLTANWLSLYKACRNVAKQGETVKSTMIWGCQWDETMNWLKNTKFKNNLSAVDTDAKTWGNYMDNPLSIELNQDVEWGYSYQITGLKEEWSANNIYDLAGNYGEFTQETYANTARVFRGEGFCNGSDYPPANRDSWGPNTPIATRVTLYINP